MPLGIFFLSVLLIEFIMEVVELISRGILFFDQVHKEGTKRVNFA